MVGERRISPPYSHSISSAVISAHLFSVPDYRGKTGENPVGNATELSCPSSHFFVRFAVFVGNVLLIFSFLDETANSHLTFALGRRMLAPSSKPKPMTRSKYTKGHFPQRAAGSERAAERRSWNGPWRAGRTAQLSRHRRAFPPLPRKDVCWHIAERTFIVNLGGTAEVSDFCPKRTYS